MSLRRKGRKVPSKENIHITKILEYINVLSVELHCSSQKPNLTLVQDFPAQHRNSSNSFPGDNTSLDYFSWPSFHDVISSDAVTFTDDFSYGMHRVETSCSQGRTSQHLSTREQTCDLRSSTQAYPHETLVWEAATRVHRWRSERCTSMLQRLRLRPCFHISSIRMFLENTVSTSPQFTSSMGLTAIINEVLA
ncbi:methionine-R-sulfoxide reductase B3 isoform X3 [Camelus ferus]|uniref:Methionine-R-sulfoxide reductase B3 isoform X3 n=2 Tax=Camelus TaxID=9836 RepID=A0A8B8U3R9_CAMFR|nr:methionine-R-sulfoxide reductase B3 isoform X2 [Camelus dromedarius]XP_031318647.1 methionine-R-sulfoxide reductase B3 isoform X2 [Camelus dromedarius]XP_032349233.1 methionine-R-sulfoxide reductase B3 isoform X3 [Camelus ferus]XP_032349234.1 methionine-R-sulfoxide reductase B3 isoform X3 [Camelus ferus]XP_045362972.1 methionine-R-sulfoxide reductase B3 isoform X2 [Camelus bactrianus]XP_045362973.1 methionine-R-sulfoxide reductase B3 isoform X2 [Camelus bactrianus]